MTGMASLKPQETFSVVPMDASVGAEILGIDLSSDMDDATFAEIREAFYRHSVIFFRKQRITEEQQITFSRRFGELEAHVMTQYLHLDHPEILIVSNVVENGRNIGIFDAGRYWHSDLSYMPKTSLASILYALEVPRDDDGQPLGDTMFASVTAAYDALPENIKRRVAGLKALNSHKQRYEKYQKDGDTIARAAMAKLTDEQQAEAVHPVVRTHPVTGRKCIFVNEVHTARILDIPDDESGKLLKLLCSQCIRPEFVYRHKWQVGDVLMWDNCAVQHLAVADYKLPRRRRMHRTTIAGTIPF